MMNDKEKIIKIPKGIGYISDWKEFESSLPKSDKLIIDLKSATNILSS